MHAHILAFHEAVHGLLCPVPWLNDFFGLHVSLFNLLSLKLYRVIHVSHHVYLATPRDYELWPFVDPTTPRWTRRLAAFLELTCGMIFTPLLFFRAYLRMRPAIRNAAVRRWVEIEQTLVIVMWLAVLAAVAWWDLWKYWLLMYLAPAFLAGNLQSVRKYVEHMGLFGSRALTATRSIVPPGPAGKLVAYSLFNEPYHGAHHLYARIPQTALPEANYLLVSTPDERILAYPNYWRALGAMVRTLGDPRIGSGWQAASVSDRSERCVESPA
jgi:fatty acid desaturase